MSESPEPEVEPQGVRIPVFSTANIPAETLNLLLKRDRQTGNEESFRLLIVTDVSEEAIQAIIDQPSVIPFSAFTSPFMGKRIVPDLNEIFWTEFHGHRHFTNYCFFILDSISARDETLTVVEARDPADITPEDDGIDNLRTDFWVARQVAMLAELGVEGLLEERDVNTVYTKDMPGAPPLEL